MYGAQKVLSSNGFRMANCFCCLSQNAMALALLTAVNNYNKSLEKLQDFFFKTETKTKTKCSRPRPILHDPRPRPRLSFLSSRRLETKTLVSRTTSPRNVLLVIQFTRPFLASLVFILATPMCVVTKESTVAPYDHSHLNQLKPIFS